MSWVYFVRERGTKAVKIGSTQYLGRRLTALQCGNPRELSLAAVKDCGTSGVTVERSLQRRFASSAIGGEWFEETPEMTSLIEDWGAPSCGICHRHIVKILMIIGAKEETPQIFCSSCAPAQACA